MREDWFPFLKFPLPFEQFMQLPTSADYKYEYIDGEVWLTPRPKYFRAAKALQPVQPPTEVDAQGLVRNGFKLLSYPGSLRRRWESLRRKESPKAGPQPPEPNSPAMQDKANQS